jgi:phosphoserine aminotransferase
VASFGLSSSLRKKITRIQKKKKDQEKQNLEKRIEYTYESSNSKISRSEPFTVVCSCGTSFGLDVPKEVKSSTHFCFFSAS